MGAPLWTPTAWTPLLFWIYSLYKWVQKSKGVQVVGVHGGSVIGGLFRVWVRTVGIEPKTELHWKVEAGKAASQTYRDYSLDLRSTSKRMAFEPFISSQKSGALNVDPR